MSSSSLFNFYDLVNDAIDRDFFFNDVRVSPRYDSHPHSQTGSKQLTSGANSDSSSKNALVHNNNSSNPFSLFGSTSIFDDNNSLMLPVQSPPLNIIDKDTTYELKVAIPGVPKKDINLDFDDSKKELTISGKSQETVEDNDDSKNNNRVYKEIRSGSFLRRVRFGKDANLDSANIKASLTNGILKVAVPKVVDTKNKKSIVKRIKIEGGEEKH